MKAMHILKRFARFFNRAATWVRNRPIISGVAALAALYVLYSLFFSNGKVVAETMVVEPQEFTAAVSVAGTVVAAQDVDLGFSTGGRIGAVRVKAGDRVSAGMVLASLENGDARAELLRRQAALESARARYSQTAQGARSEELAIAESDTEAAREALATALRDSYRAADDAVRNKTGELFENPRTSASFKFAASNSRHNSIVVKERKELEFALSAWQDSQTGLDASSDLDSAAKLARENLAKAAAFLTNLNLALAAAEPEQGYVTQAQLSDYISDVAAARSAVNAAQASLNTDASALESAEKNLALERAGSTPQEIAIEAANVKAAEADVAAAQAELQKTLITAPFAGVVGQIDAKVGAIASANTPLVSMLASDTFLIESYVPEIAIADIAVGDAATVHLDAYGPNAPFAASVIRIDPAETERDGVSTYKTTLQFTNPDERIRSGLTANMTISTERKPGALVIPQGALVRRGEQTFVKVLVDDEAVERPVTTGLSSVGHIEITSGLSAGDTVVLNP